MATWVIVTGHSRGLGRAMAAQAVAAGCRVLGLARSPSGLDGVEEWPVDLADPGPAAARLEAWLQGLDRASVASIRLVNNAARLAPPAPLQLVPRDELAQALRVGLEAPVLLTQAFLAGTQPWIESGWRGDRRVLQISSGLGRFAMAAVGSYCAAKAGLDNFTRSVALDQAAAPHGAKLVSLAPGIVQTDMQQELRGADPRGFPDHATFVQYHESGALATPADAAAQCLAFLDRPDFGAEVVADVR